MQSSWATELDPVIANPLAKALILPNVSLKASSVNQVNHKLGRKLVGWVIIRKRGPAYVWDVQDSNQQDKLTLLLQTSADTIVDLAVF